MDEITSKTTHLVVIFLIAFCVMTLFSIPLLRLPRLLGLFTIVGQDEERVVFLPLVDNLESEATALVPEMMKMKQAYCLCRLYH